MRHLLLPLVVALLASCAAPQDVQRQLVATPIPKLELSEVEQLGREIYLKDVAAHRATDAVLAQVDSVQGEFVGWITLLSGSRSQVLFIDDQARAVYSVELDVSTPLPPVVTELKPPGRLDPGASAMWAARRTALSSSFRRCSDRYNTVVVEQPRATPSRWLVYLLAATPEPGVVMLGGHHRFAISSDGTEVLEHLPLTKSCIKSEPRRDGEVAALMVTHIVTNEPIESHVYLSLLHELPLYVGTDGAIWAVEQGRIRRAE